MRAATVSTSMPANSGCGRDQVTSVLEAANVRSYDRMVDDAEYG
jgi:hypothetical protein